MSRIRGTALHSMVALSGTREERNEGQGVETASIRIDLPLTSLTNRLDSKKPHGRKPPVDHLGGESEEARAQESDFPALAHREVQEIRASGSEEPQSTFHFAKSPRDRGTLLPLSHLRGCDF